VPDQTQSACQERKEAAFPPPAEPRAGLGIGIYYGTEQDEPVVVPLDTRSILVVANPAAMAQSGYGDPAQNGVPVLYYVTEADHSHCWLVAIDHVGFRFHCAPITDATRFVREYIVTDVDEAQRIVYAASPREAYETANGVWSVPEENPVEEMPRGRGYFHALEWQRRELPGKNVSLIWVREGKAPEKAARQYLDLFVGVEYEIVAVKPVPPDVLDLTGR
jgi:hypothetical protein